MALTATYSNGLDTSRVLPALINRIGWIGQTVPPISGRYYEDFHALVNNDNITSLMPKSETIEAFKARLARAAVTRCLSAVFRETEYLEQGQFMATSDWHQQSLITSSESFVGFKIFVPYSSDIAVQIDSLILHFNTSDTFKVYLFAANNAAPIWEKTVTTIANELTIVPIDNVVLNHLTLGSNSFYLGYFQSEVLLAQAIGYSSYMTKTNCLSVRGMVSVASELTFDTAQVQYPADSMGLNFQYSSFRDHTAQCINKAALFDEAIGLTVAYSLIEQILYSTRSNATERITKEELDKVGISLDLKGYAPISDGPSVRGLAQRIDEEMKRLRLSFFPKPKVQVINLC